MPSFHPYWTQRNARDRARKALAQDTARKLWDARAQAASVVTVLAGYDAPIWTERYPVVIHNANGSRTYCNHLA